MRRPRTVAFLVAIAAVAVGLAACGHSGRADEPVVALDGSARLPDDEGVATSLTTDSITLDGKRTYPVSRRLLSFSTYTGKIEPMLTRDGQYVQIGLDDEGGRKKMVWMAGVADVVRSDPPAVYYTGIYARTAKGRFVFRDGTVLRVTSGTADPPAGARLTMQIDPTRHEAAVLQTAPKP